MEEKPAAGAPTAHHRPLSSGFMFRLMSCLPPLDATCTLLQLPIAGSARLMQLADGTFAAVGQESDPEAL